MKLGAAALLLFKQSAEAVVTCSNGADLFTAQCTTAGFVLTVDETCRTADFNGIDFANSFVWGVNTVTSMDVPGCATPGACIGDDVVAGSGVTCQVKPDGTSGAYTWTVPLGNCATTGQYEGSPTSGNPYYYYELFWNSAVVVDTANSIIQMNQIKFTCKLESLQEDAGAIVVSEGEMVADDEFKLNLQDVLQLSVYKLDSSTATMPTSASAYLQDGSVATQTQALTYETSPATTANLGDHMELRLEAVGASTVLRDYSVSLYKCWASKDALPTDTDGTDTSTTADTALQFPFWNEFCPLFGWVGPEAYDGANSATPTGGAYLKEQWDQQTSLHAVHFRQFAFINTGFTVGTDSIYYHCTVKVCLRAAEGTCSGLVSQTKRFSTKIATCPTYPAYSAAGRKKRSIGPNTADMIRLDAEVEAKSINYEDCKLRNGNICLEEKKKSSSLKLGSSLAAYFVMITLYGFL